MNQQRLSVSAIVGLVLAIIALLLAAVPIINNFAIILAILGLIFGIVGIMKIKKGKRSGSKIAISSVIISVIAIIVVFISQAIYGAALDGASKAIDESVSEATGDKTEDVLKDNLNVELGTFAISKDEYDFTTTSLPVTVTNKLAEKKSFSIQVEAVDSNGKRIADDYVYANDLGPNQTQDFKIFTYIEEGKLEAMKAASFKIVNASQY
jgi:hypothetical protein